MKLPRNLKIFRGQLDVAPFASLTFLLLIFLVLESKLVFTPGVRIDLPEVQGDLPGTSDPTVVVSIDRNGQLYYQSQAISLSQLRVQLVAARQRSPVPLTLEVQADKAATWEATVPVLTLARESGLRQAHLVTRPRPEAILKGVGK